MMNIDFIGKRKIYYTISLTLIAIGILVSAILGVKMDIQFKGGTIIQYSYTGTIEKDKTQADLLAAAATKSLGQKADVTFATDYKTSEKHIVFTLGSNISEIQQAKLYTDLAAAFKSNNFKKYLSDTVSPQMGAQFFRQSLLAVLLASALIILYIWIRFRKIGGLPAGITAFIALVHDVIMAFVAFSIFRIALNDNFIAVALTILGYSINDTIVVYDRIRENRKIYGTKMTFKDIVNKSINQTFSRSINTVLVTFVAIAVICVFAIANNLESIRSFALPMMVGVATGAYSTICIAGPLWVTWEDYKTNKEKKLKEAKLKAKNEKKALAK
jgi:preprotein translocase subunit SecF